MLLIDRLNSGMYVCVCMWVHMETRGSCWMPPCLAFYLILLKRGLLLNLELSGSASQQTISQSVIFLTLSL